MVRHRGRWRCIGRKTAARTRLLCEVVAADDGCVAIPAAGWAVAPGHQPLPITELDEAQANTHHRRAAPLAAARQAQRKVALKAIISGAYQRAYRMAARLLLLLPVDEHGNMPAIVGAAGKVATFAAARSAGDRQQLQLMERDRYIIRRRRECAVLLQDQQLGPNSLRGDHNDRNGVRKSAEAEG